MRAGTEAVTCLDDKGPLLSSQPQMHTSASPQRESDDLISHSGGGDRALPCILTTRFPSSHLNADEGSWKPDISQVPPLPLISTWEGGRLWAKLFISPSMDNRFTEVISQRDTWTSMIQPETNIRNAREEKRTCHRAAHREI